MHPFPHKYDVAARATPTDDVVVESARLPSIQSAPPIEFGGPGDRWSPETLLVAAVADCFVLTFRAIASFSRLSWVSLTCEVSGTVDRVDRVTQFTGFDVRARLLVPAGCRRGAGATPADQGRADVPGDAIAEGRRAPGRDRRDRHRHDVAAGGHSARPGALRPAVQRRRRAFPLSRRREARSGDAANADEVPPVGHRA